MLEELVVDELVVEELVVDELVVEELVVEELVVEELVVDELVPHEFVLDELAGVGFTGVGYVGDGFTGVGFVGDGFAGVGFVGDGFAGVGFVGDGFSGDGFSGDGFSGDGFSGDGFSGVGFVGDELSVNVPGINMSFGVMLIQADAALLSFVLSSGTSDFSAHPERLAAHIAEINQTDNNLFDFIKSRPFIIPCIKTKLLIIFYHIFIIMSIRQKRKMEFFWFAGQQYLVRFA